MDNPVELVLSVIAIAVGIPVFLTIGAQLLDKVMFGA